MITTCFLERPHVYIELFKQLEADKVRYMVAGGLAVNLLGVPRSTRDVDLVLALDNANPRTVSGGGEASGRCVRCRRHRWKAS